MAVLSTAIVAGCTNTHGPAASTTPATTASPSALPTTELPVVSCPTTYGVRPESPFVAHELPAATDSHHLSFYSNGFLTVLAPVGWSCSALVAVDGGESLDVYSPSEHLPTTSKPAPGTALVEIEGDYTAHLPGDELVCAFFPASYAATAVQQGGMQCPAPAQEVHHPLTQDIVAFTDPSGVTGSGAGSGGNLDSVGDAVYPQVSSNPGAGVNVALLSCTLPAGLSPLCPTIQTDFLVRYAPSYAGSAG